MKPSRVDWLLLGGLLLLRFAAYIDAGFSVSGDTPGYLSVATHVLEHGSLPPPWVHLHGYGLLLALLGGGGDASASATVWRMGRLHQLLDLSVVAVLCLLARRLLLNRPRWALWLAWAVICLQPFTGTWSRVLWTEQVTTSLTFLGWLLTCLWVYRRETRQACLGLALAALITSIASLQRADILVLNGFFVLAFFVFLFFLARPWLPAARTRALCFLLASIALPFTIATWQFASTGHFALYSTNYSYYPGYGSWLRTWPANPAEHARFAFFSQRHYWTRQHYPDKAFDSEAEKQEFFAIMDDWKELHLKDSPDINARFQKIVDAKIAAHPVRHYLLHPLYRMFRLWANLDGSQFYTVPFALQRPFSTLVTLLTLLMRLLLIALALVATVATLRQWILAPRLLLPQTGLRLFADLSLLYLMLRTLEIGALSPFLFGGLMDTRYINVAMPFLLVAALLGARRLLPTRQPAEPTPLYDSEIELPAGRWRDP